MWLVFVATALAASPWAGKNGDIVAERAIDASADAIYEELVDLETLEQLFPEHCATDILYGEQTTGVGATIRLTYHAAAMHRRLEGTLVDAVPGSRVDIEHAGQKGFFTRFALEEEGGSTVVNMTSFIDPPPWPFAKSYFTRVRPAWTQCYIDALDELDAMMQAQAPPPPAEPAAPESAP